MRYARTEYSFSFGGPLTPVVRGIIVACTIVWIVEVAAGGMVHWLAFTPAMAIRGAVWQPFTYIFLHARESLMHLLFNMLVLYMFGCEIERHWGGRKFMTFFLFTGAVAAFCLGLLSLPIVALRYVPVVGASGSIFGIIVVWALMFPDRQAFLFPFPVAIRARWFAFIIIGIELLTVYAMIAGVSPIVAAGGSLAHLGGAAAGYLYYTQLRHLRGMPDPRGAYRRWQNRRIARKFRIVVDENFLGPGGEDEPRRKYPN